MASKSTSNHGTNSDESIEGNANIEKNSPITLEGEMPETVIEQKNKTEPDDTASNGKLNPEDIVVSADAQNNVLLSSFDWSQKLKSPAIHGFSPSKIGSYHGIGLQQAMERNKSIAASLVVISSFLSGIATVYEQLGIDLMKTSQSIHPRQITFKTPIAGDLQSLYDSLMSLGSCYRNSAEYYRNSIISSLQKALSENSKLADDLVKKYKEIKLTSVEARKLALKYFSECTNAANAADEAIRLWSAILQQKKNNNKILDASEGQGEGLTWEKSLELLGLQVKEIDSTDRVIQKLNFFLLQETQYFESVSKENESIKTAEEVEVSGLRNVQKMEQNILHFFINELLLRIFPKDSTNGKCISLTTSTGFRTSGDLDKTFTDIEKKGKDLLANLFKQQSVPYEEGMGQMDAETLGLPESAGLKRDKVKSSFAARENRIKLTEIVVKLFNDVIDVTSQSSANLRSKITLQRNRCLEDNTSIGIVWLAVANLFEDEAKLILESTIKVSKLDNWLLNSKRNLANEIDMDNTIWKNVCDAARSEMRFEARYKATKQQMEKVRQRASSKEISSKELFQRGSVDSFLEITSSVRSRNDSSGSMGTPNRVGRAFFKGGEAMKKLAEKSIVQIQQIGMNEVDQKEAKDQLALDEATAIKKKAIQIYITSTTERIEKIESEDEEGWTEMREAIEKLAQSIGALQNVRCTLFEERISKELHDFTQTFIENVQEWLEKTKDKILNINQKPSSTKNAIPEEYSLTKKTVRTENIDDLLNLSEPDPSIITKLKIHESANEKVRDDEVGSDEINLKKKREISSAKIPAEEISETMQIQSNISSFNTSNHSFPVNEDRSVSTSRKVVEEAEGRPDMKAFVKYFWSNKPTNDKLPDILEIYTCAYRPKEKVAFLTPYFPGKLYTSEDRIYFLGREKQFSLEFEAIRSIKKQIGFMGSSNDNDLVITCRSNNTIISFILCRFKSRDKVLIHLQTLKEKKESSIVTNTEHISSDSIAKETQLQPVPQDLLLKKMEIVVSKPIKNVSITSVFKNTWADRSFYDSWLRHEECFEISMEDWKCEGDMMNEWCNETYDQKRLVTFKFNRTTHLYIGPPVALVKQQHYCRVEGEDKCIVAISAQFDGIPYSDCFAVEMRWVASRKGTNDVLIQVGLFVVFKKHTMLKNQIRSGTIAETKNVHTRLFNAVKKACLGSDAGDGDKIISKAEEEEEVEEEGEETEQTLLDTLLQNFSACKIDLPVIASTVGLVTIIYLVRASFGTSNSNSSICSNTQNLENQIQELKNEVRALHKSIDLIADTIKETRSSSETYTHVGQLVKKKH